MILRRLPALLISLFLYTTAAHATDSKFKIGFTLPLTGSFSEFGAAVRNALQLVQEENPALFEKIHFILEDDQYNAKNCVSAYQKLKNIDHAQLILVWGNEPALAVAPLAENDHFPLVAFGQTPAIAANRNSVVRILGPATEFGKPIAKYLSSQKASSVQMLLVENTFYRLVSESVQSSLEASTKFNILAAVPASETDFRPYLIKMKQLPHDYLGVFLAPGQLIPFFKQANELQIKNPIFGSTSFESKAVVSEARELMKGAVYAHIGIDAEWHKKYTKRFGDDIQVSYAAVAFDTFLAIANIINTPGDQITGKEVLEKLVNLPLQHGAAGSFKAMSSPEHGRYVSFDVMLKKIIDGIAHQTN